MGWQQSPLGSWWGLLLGRCVLGGRHLFQRPPAVVLGQPRGHGWVDSEPPACALTAAFAFRSPHYACPEVIRVSSHHAPLSLPVQGTSPPPSRTPDPPPGPLFLHEANHTALAGRKVRRAQGGRVELRSDPVRAAGGEPAVRTLLRPAPPPRLPARPSPFHLCAAPLCRPSRPVPRPTVTPSPAGRGRCPSTMTTCGSCWRR